MKKALSVLLTMCVLMCLAACKSGSAAGETTSVQQDETSYTQDLMDQMTDEIGMPEITNYYEKNLAKAILEKRDDSDLICYVYNQTMDGEYVYVGRSMGYGLPASVQYTNPEAAGYITKYSEISAYTIPQADPNGLYSAEGLDATWLMMIDDETGETYIMYTEPEVTVVENKLPRRIVTEKSLEGVDY